MYIERYHSISRFKKKTHTDKPLNCLTLFQRFKTNIKLVRCQTWQRAGPPRVRASRCFALRARRDFLVLRVGLELIKKISGDKVVLTFKLYIRGPGKELYTKSESTILNHDRCSITCNYYYKQFAASTKTSAAVKINVSNAIFKLQVKLFILQL